MQDEAVIPHDFRTLALAPHCQARLSRHAHGGVWYWCLSVGSGQRGSLLAARWPVRDFIAERVLGGHRSASLWRKAILVRTCLSHLWDTGLSQT